MTKSKFLLLHLTFSKSALPHLENYGTQNTVLYRLKKSKPEAVRPMLHLHIIVLFDRFKRTRSSRFTRWTVADTRQTREAFLVSLWKQLRKCHSFFVPNAQRRVLRSFRVYGPRYVLLALSHHSDTHIFRGAADGIHHTAYRSYWPPFRKKGDSLINQPKGEGWTAGWAAGEPGPKIESGRQQRSCRHNTLPPTSYEHSALYLRERKYEHKMPSFSFTSLIGSSRFGKQWKQWT